LNPTGEKVAYFTFATTDQKKKFFQKQKMLLSAVNIAKNLASRFARRLFNLLVELYQRLPTLAPIDPSGFENLCTFSLKFEKFLRLASARRTFPAIFAKTIRKISSTRFRSPKTNRSTVSVQFCGIWGTRKA